MFTLLSLIMILEISIYQSFIKLSNFPGGLDGKASAYNARDPGLIPGLGGSSGEGNGNPLQHSCLENPMDGGVWLATVHGVAKSQTQLRDFASLYQVEKIPFCSQVAEINTCLLNFVIEWEEHINCFCIFMYDDCLKRRHLCN